MSRLHCPVDADLLEAVNRGELSAENAAIYTACRQVVKLRAELEELKKKVDAPGSAPPPSPITLVPVGGSSSSRDSHYS